MTQEEAAEREMREQFEAWAQQSPANLERLDSGPYVSSTVSFAWRAWRASRAAVPQWQPIETAPKDCYAVLLGFNDEELGGFVGQGRWHEEDHDGPDNMGHDAGFMDDQYSFFRCARSFGNPAYQSKGTQPTHWMPLPAPPITPQGAPNAE